MHRHPLTLAVLVVILSTLAPIPLNGSQQETGEKLSAKEEQEVREFASQFAASLEKTRDLTPYLNAPPASSLLDKVITDPDDSAGIVDKDVVSKVGTYQLRQFYIALWNIAYLSESYIYGRFLRQKTFVGDLLPQQKYPAHVVRLLKRNPTIRKWWKDVDSSDSEGPITTVAQFYSVWRTYSEAAILMRTYFKRHPPESTAIYKQNLTYLGSYLNEISVDTCDSEQDCAGLPLRTKTIKLNLPTVQLFLVRLNGRLQVLSVGLYDD